MLEAFALSSRHKQGRVDPIHKGWVGRSNAFGFPVMKLSEI